MELTDILAGANVALRLIQARIVILIALFLTAGMYAWALWQPGTLRAILAAVWGLTIFLPILYKTGTGGHDASPEERPERGAEESATPG